MLIALAIALAWLAGAACYLTSEHQRFRAQRLPAQPARTLSLVAAVACFACWWLAAGPSAGIAAAFMSLCLGLLVWPYLASGWHWLRGDAHVE
ncbi:hypothetical protein [Pandoraea apista]|nr:hypothetical protein [Pandoraea apista]AJE99827.1 hypothetical protein SG18_19385 [Pandoraea apista]AKH73958.1 hypothetical protein XM39_19570 [Pandoraea apista]AKI62505.1 hypothetical protein AA956_12885 [Pandoraea apista]AVF40767.1 hypothetical protein AL486_14400 [Pandoraea apista]OXS96437.1 hypothetical protein B7H01_05080 [Pandoraea apista]